jgi:hypothetical protein
VSVELMSEAQIVSQRRRRLNSKELAVIKGFVCCHLL